MYKLYYHLSWEIKSDGRVVCSLCGAELTDGVSPQPCKVWTPAQSVMGTIKFEISVWNRKIFLIAFEDINGKRVRYELKTTPDIEAMLEDLAFDSINESGGSIDTPGVYALSKIMEEYLEEAILSKAVVLVPFGSSVNRHISGKR